VEYASTLGLGVTDRERIKVSNSRYDGPAAGAVLPCVYWMRGVESRAMLEAATASDGSV
jgi:hypothetical protein